MRIYIDFDDVLCETAKALSVLAREMFGRDVPYDDIRFFDLQKSFALSGVQLEQLMARAHEYDFLASLAPTPGGADAIRALEAAGHEVVIVTGRQSVCHSGSTAWLRKHGLAHLEIVYVDKYGRAPAVPPEGAPAMLSLGAFNRLHFDIAIDDSPTALDLLAPRRGCRTIIFDRPWNRTYHRPHAQRATTWAEIVAMAGV
ncbi:MAG: 2-dehydropantoate 2-reductase [Kiritimatiellaeota bacterium]|nr:2-dehydropantoate 2-reductase [Kiritimatiellota bacterium]